MDVFNKFIAFGENITIFRAVDPGLVHVFHPRYCDDTLPADQFKMCQGTKADSSIGLRQLSQIFYSDRKLFASFARKVNKLDKPATEITNPENSKENVDKQNASQENQHKENSIESEAKTENVRQ